jgi:ubiquinone biosynthesis accessory factor UbiK
MVRQNDAPHRIGTGASLGASVEALVNWSHTTKGRSMLKQKLATDMFGKVSEVIAMSPARDLEKNLKASLSAWLGKLDLVTREEFDVQTEVLARTRIQLQELEARLARLETPDTPAQ